MDDPTGVLGMAIERFQMFALFRDRRRLTKRFSIAWFFASWTFALCFLFVLLAQIEEGTVNEKTSTKCSKNDGAACITENQLEYTSEPIRDICVTDK